MAEEKSSFILYCDLIDTVEKLSDETAGKLFKHILRFVNDQNPEADDQFVDLVFAGIKNQLKRDLKKWEITRGQRSGSGSLGNLKRWNKDLYDKVVEGNLTLDEAVIVAKNRKTSQGDKVPSHPIAKIAVNATANVSVPVPVNDNVLSIDNNRFADQLIQDRQWIETAFMKHRIDPEKITSVISSFNNHLILRGKQKQSMGEYKEHLSNWLRTTDLSEYQHQMSVNGKTNQRGKTAKDYGDE